MLGVRPDASHDDVKRAFATRALYWHPDRQQDSGPDDLRRAEFHMAELNAAWAVLRSPARRAAYDTSLVPTTEERDRTSAPGPDPHAGAAPLVPAHGRRRPPAGGLPLGCVWLLATAGVLLVIALVALLFGDTERADIDVRTREPLGVGACVVTGSAGGAGGAVTVVEVPCGTPHDGVVAERTAFPKPCSAGLTAVLLDDALTVVCLRPETRPAV